MTRDLRSLTLVLTAACNLDCAYCFENRKGRARMDRGLLDAALDVWLASEALDRQLVFYGGEPLLEPELMRRAVEAIEAEGRASDVVLRLSTNGLLLAGNLLEWLVERDVRVQLSCDGVAQDLRAPGTFQVLDRVLRNLRREQPRFLSRRLSVSMTVTATNLELVAASVRYLLERDVAEISLNPSTVHDAAWTPGCIDCLDAQMAAVVELSLAHLRRTGQVPVTNLRRSAERRPVASGEDRMCSIGQGDGLVVDVDGQASACVSCVESYQALPAMLRTSLAPLRLGDVRDAGLGDALQRCAAAACGVPIFTRKGAKSSSYGRCSECRWLDDCLVCPVSIGWIPGNEDPDRIPDNQCAFNRVMLRHRAEFPARPSPRDVLTGSAPLPEAMLDLAAGLGVPVPER